MTDKLIGRCSRPNCRGTVLEDSEGESKCMLCGRPAAKAVKGEAVVKDTKPKRPYTKRPGIIYGGPAAQWKGLNATQAIICDKCSYLSELIELKAKMLLLQAEYIGYRQAVKDLRGEEYAE